MPKNQDDLEKSREGRLKILSMFGGSVPESIMKFDPTDRPIDLFATGKKTRSTGTNLKKNARKLIDGGMDAKQAKAFQISSVNRKEGGSLSIFPQNIGRSALMLYTKDGDTVVDPFAGHNSRMELCWRANRNYYGQDLSHEFMEANRKIKKILLNEAAFFKSTAKIKLFEGSSTTMQMKSNFGDFTITSPPYWDIEYYGDEPEQMGKTKTYKDFLNMLKLVVKENHRVLKPGAFCVWFINDFRKNKIFYNYHGDLLNIMKKVGFIQHDIIISDLGSSIGAVFANQIVERKILPKRHEYGLVMRKPKE